MARYYKHDRHNFDPAYKLHLCCAEDMIRPVMEYVHFINGYAYATNAHVMVRAKIADISDFTEEEIAMLNNKSIHGHLFRQLIQRRRVEVTPDGFVWNDDSGDISQTFKFHKITEDRCVQLFKNDTLKIPNFDAIIDNDFEANTQPTPAIGIRFDLLEAISRAMNTDKLAFFFKGDNKAIHVRPLIDIREHRNEDIVRIVMPMLLDNMKEYQK